MISIKTFSFNPYETNSYVCYSGGEAVLVDASASSPSERGEVVRFLEEQGLTVRHLLLTHAHFDHIVGCAFFGRKYSLQWHAHPDCTPMLRFAGIQGAFVGMRVEKPPLPVLPLREGNRIALGSAVLKVLYTPGHAPGSVCFYDREAGVVLVGDVLFNGSIGRYDLPGGNLATLMQSIYQKLLVLPDETVVYAGHGPPTTIGQERAHNPFLQ